MEHVPAFTDLDIRKDFVRESMMPLHHEHKMEMVAKKNGVMYINDSRSTNVNQAWYALSILSAPILWIAGGGDEGDDYTLLHELVRQKVTALYILGTDPSKLRTAMLGVLPVVLHCTTMHEAVVSARVYADAGDTVLLSPASASFDLYENYEARGRAFKHEVNLL